SRCLQCFQCRRKLGVSRPELQPHCHFHDPSATKQHCCTIRSARPPRPRETGIFRRVRKVPPVFHFHWPALPSWLQHSRLP
ncbi:hypothetical protein H0H93_003020, partial [Arthromyces matolae]